MPSLRILLADQSAEAQRSTAKLAAQFGYEIVEARTGNEVLRIALETSPALIVLDVEFSDADGRDVLARLKADPRTEPIPVVVWSGRDYESDRKIALKLGAEDFIEKTDPQTLFGKLKRVLLRLETER